MKRKVAAGLVVALMVCMSALAVVPAVHDELFSESDAAVTITYSYNTSAKTATVTNISGVDQNSEVYIPAVVAYEGAMYDVTQITGAALSGKYFKSLKVGSVEAPVSSISLGEPAFQGNWAIRSFVVYGNVGEICKNAFAGSGLTSVEIRGNVGTIGESAFSNTFNGNNVIKTFVVYGHIGEICKNAFAGSGLNHLALYGGAGIIREGALSSTWSLKTADLGNVGLIEGPMTGTSLEYLGLSNDTVFNGNYLFVNAWPLKSVYLSNATSNETGKILSKFGTDWFFTDTPLSILTLIVDCEDVLGKDTMGNNIIGPGVNANQVKKTVVYQNPADNTSTPYTFDYTLDKWVKLEGTTSTDIIVTFNPQYETGAVSVKKIAKGSTVDFPVVYRDGYSFEGWFTSPTGGNKVVAGTTFTENTNLYARWNLLDNVLCSIVYNVGEGSVSAPASVFVYKGNGVVLASYDGTIPGFEFVGWTDGKNTFNAGYTYFVNNVSTVLTAVWAPVSSDQDVEPLFFEATLYVVSGTTHVELTGYAAFNSIVYASDVGVEVSVDIADGGLEIGLPAGVLGTVPLVLTLSDGDRDLYCTFMLIVLPGMGFILPPI